MKRELKKALIELYEAPIPQKKQAFLKQIREPGISNRQFFLLQAGYIGKWVWLVSVIIFLGALFCGYYAEKNVLWVISAMMPFLAVTLITENIRSELYGMSELEMSSRFSLKSVLFARMGIIGMVHLVILCFAVGFGGSQSGSSLFCVGVYLLVPYLLTDVIGLWIVRKIHGKEAVYASFGVAVLIMLLPILDNCMFNTLYQPGVFGWWVALLIVLCVRAVSEWKKRIDGTEEFVWNW